MNRDYAFDYEEKIGRCPLLNSYFIILTKAVTGGVLFCNIYKKTPASKSLLNKVAGRKDFNSKETLITPTLKKIYVRLLSFWAVDFTTMLTLRITPTLSFEPRFHHQPLRQKKQTLVVLGLLVTRSIIITTIRFAR